MNKQEAQRMKLSDLYFKKLNASPQEIETERLRRVDEFMRNIKY